MVNHNGEVVRNRTHHVSVTQNQQALFLRASAKTNQSVAVSAAASNQKGCS